MNFEAHKKVLMGLAAALAVWGIAYFVLIGPVWSAAGDEQERRDRLRTDLKEFYTKGDPIETLYKQALRDEQTLNMEVVRARDRIQFRLLRPFADTAGHDKFHFQKVRDDLYNRAVAAGLVEKGKVPGFGFSAQFQEKRSAAELLKRLAVLERVLRAAGLDPVHRHVQDIRQVAHPGIVREGNDYVETEHIEKVPVDITVGADEKGLMRLLQDLLKPGDNALALEQIHITITDPTSGTLNCRLVLYGVFPRPGKFEGNDRPGAPGGGYLPLPSRPGGGRLRL